MNVLSLFDGMSCGRIALERLGIQVDNYYASEIDKYAIQVSQANYPDIIQVGDVTELDTSTLPKIDLIMGGSPCQGFSFAGKQLAFDDPRSALFFEFVRCVKELKPKYFLLENVRMKKEYLDVISEYMGVEPIMINSALVSAQNRVRYYWTNIPGIEQPEQRGIVLRDILETKEVEGLSDKAIDYMNRSSDKWSGGKTRKDIYIKHESEKGMCLTANMHKGVPYGVIAVDKPNQINPSKKANGVQPYMQDRVFHVDGKSHCLTKEFASRTNVGDEQEVYWRKLTPVECERLQTVPDNYTNHVSNTQRYKMLGNGWTIEVIAHILKNMEL
jgi:DNA-cytosine methyltransferase